MLKNGVPSCQRTQLNLPGVDINKKKSLNVHVILLYACEVVEIEMPQSTFTLYKSVYAEQPEASEHTNCSL